MHSFILLLFLSVLCCLLLCCFLFFESLGIDDDYGHHPRGRVIYDNLNRRFLVYLDRSLLEKKKEELIIKEFKLENMRVRFLLDEHYEHDGL